MATLTDLASVKAWMGRTDSEADAQLTELIVSVEKAIERHLGRPVLVASRTEVVARTRQFERSFRLEANPVSSITSVKIDTSRDFTSATATDPTSYTFDPESGMVWFDFDLPEGRRHIEVVYSGGLAADVTTIKSSYPDLHHAANLQVGHEHQRRNTPGSTADRNQGASATFTGQVQLLKLVRQLIGPYCRAQIAHS